MLNSRPKMPDSMACISRRTLYPAGIVASILLVCIISARPKMESREEPDLSPRARETQEFVRLLETNDYINGLCIAILKENGGEIGDPELISLIAFSPKVKNFRPDQHISEVREFFSDQQCITSLVIP